MALKVGSTNIVRLYLQRMIYQLMLNPPQGKIVRPVLSNPEYEKCTQEESLVSWNSNIYICTKITQEINHLRNNSDLTIHKRVIITFDANTGTGGTTIIRTWGVETITKPSDPSKIGYDFLGWATTSGASSPNLPSFPLTVPIDDTTYYAVWRQDGTTVKPSLSIREVVSGFFTNVEIRAKNEDSSSVTIWLDTFNPPVTSRGTISPSGYTDWILVGQKGQGTSITYRAQAQASGRNKSDMVSLTVNL